MEIPEMEQTNPRKVLVLKIIAFESGMANSDNLQQDNCLWQSMCYETPLGFNISLRVIISKSRSPRVMKKYDESPLMQISEDFGTP